MRRVVALLAALTAGHAAVAGGGASGFRCRSHPGFDSMQPLRLARVRDVAGNRAYFHDDRQGCPASDGCRRKTYLMPGDEVIVDSIEAGWACAWFDGPRGTTMGYLHANQVELEKGPPMRLVPPGRLVGHWERVSIRGGDAMASLDFELDVKLSVKGEALWFGELVDGDRVVHTGSIEIAALGMVHDAAGGYEDGDVSGCGATFSRIGKFLVADDNGKCGGMNVTFDGIYRRAAPTRDSKR